MTDDAMFRGSSIGEIVEAWCDGRIGAAEAIAKGDFDGFRELLETALASGVPLRKSLTAAEERQALLLTDLLRAA